MDSRTSPERHRALSRRRVLAVTGAVGLGLLAGCAGDGTGDGGADTPTEPMDTRSDTPAGGTDAGSTDAPTATPGGGSSPTPTGGGTSWQRTELTDVLTDETFSIDGLTGPVAMQGFAVWCSNCQRQSEELATVDDSVTLVGLNVDPNEDAQKVRKHAEDNGWNWRFAVAPTSMTQALVDEFGPSVLHPPATPIVVTCEDGSTQYFSGSHQSAGTIESAAAEC